MSLVAAIRRWFLPRGEALPEIEEACWQAVEAELPFLDFLPSEVRPRLREMCLRFLRSHEFHGANDLQLSDRILLSIGLQACLPVLRAGLGAYRDWVGVVVYPGDFVIPRRLADDAGVVHEFDDPVLGEAWDGGPVLLSWFDRPAAAGGANVVIHEFAHKLDMRNGEVDGVPALPPDIARAEWVAALDEAYDAFCTALERGEDTWLDPYAGESPSEFFAVVAEAFFQEPLLLQEDCPELYALLTRFFGVDTAAGARRLEAANPVRPEGRDPHA